MNTWPDLTDASGLVILHAPNPMHDNGGAQRAAQMARAFMQQNWAVVFSSGGTVTESTDLQLQLDHPRLVHWATNAQNWRPPNLPTELPDKRLVITQVASRRWLRALRRLQHNGFKLAYDLIDDWTV